MSDYLLEARKVTKVFPGTVALNEVGLRVKKGEVHALCGENGAGKSTLMNIIGGVIPATDGSIFFEGKEVNITNPKEAQDMGIGFVHQELSLCEHLTVAENIFIGRLPQKNGLVEYEKLFDDADAILAKFNASFSSKEIVSNLNVSEKQVIEIAKSVSMDCKFLILDEPTSSLTDKETDKLFEIVKDLRKNEISVLYISHRMPEIFAICDRVTVLRDGEFVCEMNVNEITADDIIRSMVGRVIDNMYPEKSEWIGEELLRVENLCSQKVFKDISFTLKKGQILGFAGLVGSGRTEIMRAMCAIDPDITGDVFIEGKKVNFKSYRDCIDAGMMYLTEDRKLQGLFLDMSIMSNMSSVDLKAVSSGVFIDDSKEKLLAEEYKDKLNIKLSSVQDPVSSLSGGNQQKVVIGKWLSNKPKIIIMDEPTRGIDVGAKSEIHSLLRELCDQGVGVIIVSSELPEIMGVCDKIVVMHEGSIGGVLGHEEFSEEQIMKYASGHH